MCWRELQPHTKERIKMKFKDLGIKDCFTCDELGNGVYRRISAKKFTFAKDDDETRATVIPSINTEITPWQPEDDFEKAHEEKMHNERIDTVMGVHGNSEAGAYMKPEDRAADIVKKFDPTELIAKLKAKSWRNYRVINRSGTDIGDLGKLAHDAQFIADAEIQWDVNGNPTFLNHTFIYPDGVTEEDASFNGFFEVAVPKVYDRRVIIHSAQGLTGFDLYAALVIDNRPMNFGHGSGVNRAAHLSIVKTRTRQQNRLKRADRKRNLTTLARTSGNVRAFDHTKVRAAA